MLVTDMLTLLKVARVRKLVNKISQLNITAEEKAIYQILFWVFFIFLYTHIIACMMWYNFKFEQRWIPAVDFGAVGSRLHAPYEDMDDVDDSYRFFYQFFTMWYNSALSLALVEVNARTANQLRVQHYIYVLNAIFNATIFGIFIDLINQVKEAENTY